MKPGHGVESCLGSRTMGETWTGQSERGGQDAAALRLSPFTEMGVGLGRFSAANTGLQVRQFRHRRG